MRDLVGPMEDIYKTYRRPQSGRVWNCTDSNGRVINKTLRSWVDGVTTQQVLTQWFKKFKRHLMRLSVSYVFISYINDLGHWSKVPLRSSTIFYCRITHRPQINLSIGVFVAWHHTDAQFLLSCRHLDYFLLVIQIYS